MLAALTGASDATFESALSKNVFFFALHSPAAFGFRRRPLIAAPASSIFPPAELAADFAFSASSLAASLAPSIAPFAESATDVAASLAFSAAESAAAFTLSFAG